MRFTSMGTGLFNKCFIDDIFHSIDEFIFKLFNFILLNLRRFTVVSFFGYKSLNLWKYLGIQFL